MPSAADFLLIFPAFMIGTGLGALFTLGILGKGGSLERNVLVIALCAAGSAIGCGLAIPTENWWPPFVGPFVLAMGGAMLAGLLLPGEKSRGEDPADN